MPEDFESMIETLKQTALSLAPDALRAPLEALSPAALAALLLGIVIFVVWSILIAARALLGGRHDEADFDLDPVPQGRAAVPMAPARDFAAAFATRPASPPTPPHEILPREVAFAPEPPAPVVDDAAAIAEYDVAIEDGDRAAAAGDAQAALDRYKSGLTLARSVAFTRPDEVGAQRRVAKALLKSGDASARLGDTGGARQAYELALVLLRRLYATDEGDATLGREYAVTLERVGSAATAAGDKVSARQAFEEELRVIGIVAHRYPDEAQWGRFKAVVHVMLGNLVEYDSRVHYEQACALFDDLERVGLIQQDDARTLAQLRSVLNAA